MQQLWDTLKHVYVTRALFLLKFSVRFPVAKNLCDLMLIASTNTKNVLIEKAYEMFFLGIYYGANLFTNLLVMTDTTHNFFTGEATMANTRGEVAEQKWSKYYFL